MKKFIAFDQFWGSQWPSSELLKRYFIAIGDREWLFTDGSNGGLLSIDGLANTSGQPIDRLRVNASLYIEGNRQNGVSIMHRLWDGRVGKEATHFTRGDLSRRLEFVTGRDGDKRSLGLFIPFLAAWPAVEDFILHDGMLSQRLSWVSSVELPPDTFPEP